MIGQTITEITTLFIYIYIYGWFTGWTFEHSQPFSPYRRYSTANQDLHAFTQKSCRLLPTNPSTKKYKLVGEVKTNAKALRHLKVEIFWRFRAV